MFLAWISPLDGASNLMSKTRTLVQRVHSCIVGEPPCGHQQARAVIREVAAWMRENDTGHNAAHWLEIEAGTNTLVNLRTRS